MVWTRGKDRTKVQTIDTIDYLTIDPDFGDKTLFAKLVNEAHKRGMRVMLDAVFNHMGFASMQWLITEIRINR